ncbi:macrophage migration inhibitory factor homolog [Melanaphis sacchari]|uniref:macrophage migration inhibitory factor homolog n=1 Tax=Melanaphis sacchari TaxID=742174 RepID=UPI000DC13BEB|nr:macrophage migration inhibitory factor homolog [Melanaphis sacchari]
MPRFSLDTNLPASKIPEEFLDECTSILSNTLGKRRTYCISTVNPGLKMTLGGSNEPCGFIQVTCIGNITPEINNQHIGILTDYVNKAIGIPKNRIFVDLHPNEPETTAYLGTTFYQLYYVEKQRRLV